MYAAYRYCCRNDADDPEQKLPLSAVTDWSGWFAPVPYAPAGVADA